MNSLVKKGHGRGAVKPEDRVFLTVDFEGDLLGLRHITEDFGTQVQAIKLGQGFLLHPRSHDIQRWLRATGLKTYLDAKYYEDPDQMGYVVGKSFEHGYRYVSVAAVAGSAALAAAGGAQRRGQVVGALSTRGHEQISLELQDVVAANNMLAPEHQINTIMCNVEAIEQVKTVGDFAVIATGIRLPGDDPYDQPAVATPAEALRRGADILAIGRKVTTAPNRLAAYERVLEDIANVAA